MASALLGVIGLFNSNNHKSSSKVEKLHSSQKEASFHSSQREASFRIQTWNLRNDGFKDGESIADSIKKLNPRLPEEGKINYYGNYNEKSWSIRRIGIANDVLFNNSDIFCVQEALKNQVQDLHELLGKDVYSWVGVGRDDGKSKGEYSAIFYKTNTVKLLDVKTIWLSKTPFVPSQYPGAACIRSATIAKFELINTFKKFTVINTHWDHVSDESRQAAASLIRYIGSFEYENFGPVFVSGDFNSKAENKNSGGYKVISGNLDYKDDMNPEFLSQFKSNNFEKFKFKDFLVACPVQYRMGNFSSFTGFKKIEDFSGFGRIDFLMGGGYFNGKDKELSGFEVLRIKGGENFSDNGVRLSDHRPVTADVALH
ncbi:hypothetical protein PACTADRAFT_49869 [Pachysolen tannophilus NRRL Y-2460]|uniref:Endonuclease/exonuclease/phosphatase domain-containing protein n=1 Tax=Pachysolen tannophilus NRRL Y-2460 TaxID=669874 RepID=A0A1E4TTP1_PACTA|nr:hypothetical protein PACTADRAFT_49869 [Pachysolen tannophilus NRRL Y-2460]